MYKFRDKDNKSSFQLSNEFSSLGVNNNDSNNENKYIKKSIEDYKKFFSDRVLNPCELTNEELEIFQICGDFYSYGAGIPSSEFFPIKELKFKFQYVDKLVEIEKEDLEIFQQYSQLPGLPKLVDFLRNLQKRYHGLEDYNNIYKEWDICLTTGAQQGLDSIFRTIFNKNDTLLVEYFTYGGMFALSKPLNVNLIPIEMDEGGIIPGKLRNVLKNWEYNKNNFPKSIYIIPNQNPTGIIYSLNRKLEIYQICREFDLLIIEDDPHFFLQFKGEIDKESGNRNLEKSFFSIDNDNRVIRIDTFSKFLSSGIRMGIITTNKILINKLSNEINASCFHPSGLTQIALQKLFETWGNEGFDYQVKKVQDKLIEKRNCMKEIIDKHLSGLVEYRLPDCGLYYWLKLNYIEDSYQFFKNILHDKKVYLGLGISHTPNRIKTPFVRVTFSYMDPDETNIAFKILSNCLNKEKEKYIKQINK